jgi:hypothetical protein
MIATEGEDRIAIEIGLHTIDAQAEDAIKLIW